MKKFAEEIDDSAKEILENYEEAEEERENQENLNYETEKVLVSFPHDTPMETIETIVENEAVDYEVINDGKIDIPEDLPEYKKERLKKIENKKLDVVILAEVTLEDTVERAENKFEQYDCVVSAYDNKFLESDSEMINEIESGSGTVESAIQLTNDDYADSVSQWNLFQANVPRAWRELARLGGIYEVWVAVIDCGVDMDHPDLKNILDIEHSVDVTTKDGYTKLTDLKGSAQYANQKHGTMVAGVLMAQGNNGKGVAGVASMGTVDALSNPFKLLAIKADKNENNRHITQAYLEEGILYAVENGAEVINISYSMAKSDFSEEDKKDVTAAIETALEANVSVVCSAGNKRSSLERFPTCIPGVIGVGAIHADGKLSSYSNISKAVDIFAPGGSLSEGEPKILSTTVDGKYAESWGTSYAAPHVAGTIAMMKGIDINMSHRLVLGHLQDFTTKKLDIGLEEPVSVLDAGMIIDKMLYNYYGYK